MDIQSLSKLNQYFQQLNVSDYVVAFSGGVDSTVLLRLAVDYAKVNQGKVYAVTVNNALNPMGEAESAKQAALSMGAQFVCLNINTLEEEEVKANTPDRCYFCKKMILQSIVSFAKEHNIKTVLEGTNLSDLSVFRPGQKAIKELPVLSPLAECEVTKEDVRRIASAFCLSQATKPSMPCMATRFPYGTPLDSKLLLEVDEAENYIRDLGCVNVRIRIHGQIARIETDVFCQPVIMEHRGEIIEKVKNIGVTYVTLDLDGFYSGSMDKLISEK